MANSLNRNVGSSNNQLKQLPGGHPGEHGYIPLESLIIDVSIINAVRKYNASIAKDIEYDWEICDDSLLPLNRMEGMLQDIWDIERPPISIQRCGNLYKVTNGRHRVARAFLIGEKQISTGHEDFIKAGGESNPGPPKKGQSAAAGSSSKQSSKHSKHSVKADMQQSVKAQARVYHMTKVYNRYLAKPFPSEHARTIANNWVRSNIDDISPDAAVVCHSCGEASLYFCPCLVVVTPQKKVETVDKPNLNKGVATHYGHISYWDGDNRFQLSAQNNHHLREFANGSFSDRCIVPELYNYLTVNMQPSYIISGKDARDVRLAHCHRLFLKWIGDNMKDVLSDTMYKNRCLITIQRACDQAETRAIYAYCNPSYRKKGFGLAWFAKLFLYLTLSVAAVIILFAILASEKQQDYSAPPPFSGRAAVEEYRRQQRELTGNTPDSLHYIEPTTKQWSSDTNVAEIRP